MPVSQQQQHFFLASVHLLLQPTLNAVDAVTMECRRDLHVPKFPAFRRIRNHWKVRTSINLSSLALPRQFPLFAFGPNLEGFDSPDYRPVTMRRPASPEPRAARARVPPGPERGWNLVDVTTVSLSLLDAAIFVSQQAMRSDGVASSLGVIGVTRSRCRRGPRDGAFGVEAGRALPRRCKHHPCEQRSTTLGCDVFCVGGSKLA